MKYQSSSALVKQQRAQKMRLAAVVAGIVVLGLLIALLAFGCFGSCSSSEEAIPENDSVESWEIDEEEVNEADTASGANSPFQVRRRLLRSEIPALDFSIPYTRMFNDSNDVQLESAMKVGLKNPETITDVEHCSLLVPIMTNHLYVVDTMTHSHPYLVPEAALLLNYIGLRFREVASQHKDGHSYRFIVTSALRSDNDVARLRRSNGNASENSCHRFGTTIDITHAKFLRDDGEIVFDEWMKQAMATTLYELRFEGLCWVKYEYRQPCFHLTLRSTQYEGDLKSRTLKYEEARFHLLKEKMPNSMKLLLGNKNE